MQKHVFFTAWGDWNGFPFHVEDGPWDGVFDKWRHRDGFPPNGKPENPGEAPGMWNGWRGRHGWSGWKGFLGNMADGRVNDHLVDWHDRFVERYSALDPEDPEYNPTAMIESHQRLVDRYGRFLDRQEAGIDTTQQAIDRLAECIDELEEPSDRLVGFYDSLVEKQDEKILKHNGYLAYQDELLVYQEWLNEDAATPVVIESLPQALTLSAVPEPSTLTLLGMAGLALLGYRTRKRK